MWISEGVYELLQKVYGMFYNLSSVCLYASYEMYYDYHESNRKQIAKQRNLIGSMTENRFLEMPPMAEDTPTPM